MADVLDSYEFFHKHYPWATWLDGKIYRLSRGTDFTCSARTLKVRLYAEAVKAGVGIHIQVEPDETLVIRAYRKENSRALSV